VLVVSCAPNPETSCAGAVTAYREGNYGAALDLARRGSGDRCRLVEAAVLLERRDGDFRHEARAVLAPLPESAVKLRLLADADPGSAAANLDRAHVLASSSKDEPEVALVEISQSDQKLRSGALADAQRLAESAAGRASRLGDGWLEAQARNVLGYTLLHHERYDLAMGQFAAALRAAELAKLPGLISKSRLNLGNARTFLGDYDLADKDLDEAIRLAATLGLSARMALGIYSKANNEFMRSNWKESIPHYQQALSGTALSPRDQAGAAVNLAWAFIKTGDVTSARRYLSPFLDAQASPAAKEALLGLAEIALTERNAAEAERLLRMVLEREPSTAERWSAQHGLARVWALRGDERQAEASFQAALDIIDKDVSQIEQQELAVSYRSRLMDFYAEYVRFLYSRDPERALVVADSSRARIAARGSARKPPPTPLRTVAARTRSCLLTYWLSREGSIGWLVTPAAVFSARLPASGEIELHAERFQARIDGKKDYLSGEPPDGAWLYDNLIGPFSAPLAGCKRLILVPDGRLHRVNFETLPAPSNAGRRYWIENVTVSVALRFDGLLASPGRLALSPALIIGDADPVDRFPKLRFASAEIREIQGQLPNPAVAITGTAAVPEAYIAARPGRFALIHFSAHGDNNNAAPLESAIILSPQRAGFKLYAREVRSSDLSGTGLVTVSACDSAGTRSYSGEGLVGLSWAFLSAGARHVVGGLWNVDDRFTPEFMKHFYGQLAAGQPAPESLRNAKLHMIQNGFPKPYYWASFQLYTR